MLHKFLNVSLSELEKMAEAWKEYKRGLVWMSKPRNTEEQIKEL